MRSYNPKDIELFYERFNQLPEYYKLEKVHQLIHDPDAKATHWIKLKFKPLIFIIMASIPVIFLAVYLSWSGTAKEDALETHISSNLETQDESNQGGSNSSSFTRKEKAAKSDKKIFGLTPLIPEKNDENKQDGGNNLNNITAFSQDTKEIEDCYWPENTLIDKHDLFIYLSNDELINLGVELYTDSFYYSNKLANGSSYNALFNMQGDTSKYTQHKFLLKYSSDTLCTKHRWGHRFYNEIDTLLPVIINVSDETIIFWFTPHPDIFEALPERYLHLQDIYKQLICLKEKYPDQQFVNYWDKERNQILDEINCLILSKDELIDIGFGFFKDSISLVDETQSFKYHYSKYLLNVGTWCCIDGQQVPEIPNMFPTLITDIKGLKQYMFGNWMKSQNSSQSAFNTLVPVLMPFKDYIKGRNYEYVFWYYPTKDFLNALPDRYRNTIKAEIEYINTGVTSKEINCTYFEACKSTLQLDDLKVYPNPASYAVTVEFTSDKQIDGSISLVNISGAIIKDLVRTAEFQSGQNSFKVDLNGVSSGVYLIYIITEDGFKTQRLILSK